MNSNRIDEIGKVHLFEEELCLSRVGKKEDVSRRFGDQGRVGV